METEQSVCPRCHMPVSALLDVSQEMSVFLRKNLSRDFVHKRVCGSCLAQFEKSVTDPHMIPNKVPPELLKKLEAWASRTELLKEAGQLSRAHKNEEALAKYNEYLALMEEAFSLPIDKITTQLFRESGRREDLAVFVLVLWDLVVLLDEKDQGRQQELGKKMVELGRGLPLVGTLQARVRKFERHSKNRVFFKQMYKDLGGSGCFVASYAFEDPYAAEVMILRQFRDEYLQANLWGRRFIRTYYKYSPAMVARFQSWYFQSALSFVLRQALRLLIGPLTLAMGRRKTRQ
jgi:hypothetical protein